MSEPFQIGVASNDDAVLQANLLASPDLVRRGITPLVQRDFCSAATAYNACLDAFDRDNPILLAHQDVYLPSGWMTKLTDAMAWLYEHSPEWAVLGIIGRGTNGGVQGRTWSTGLNAEVGRRVKQPQSVVCVDELLFVLRGGVEVRFDDELPSFHLYGTDIVLTAIEQGRTAYVFDGPVIHNSLPVKRLDENYEAAYRYMQKKWQHRLPVETLIVPITETLWPIRKQRWRVTRRRICGHRFPTRRHADPTGLSKQLHYENPPALPVEAVTGP